MCPTKSSARTASWFEGWANIFLAVAQTVIESGGKATMVGADVSKAAAVARLFKEVNSTLGRLDLLVNNARVFRFRAFTDITEQTFQSALQRLRSRRFSPCRRRSSASAPRAEA